MAVCTKNYWSLVSYHKRGLRQSNHDAQISCFQSYYDLVRDEERGLFRVYHPEYGDHQASTWTEAEAIRATIRIFLGLDPVTGQSPTPEKEVCNGK